MVNSREEDCTKPRMPNEDEASVRCTMCSRPIPAEDAFEKNGEHFCCVAIAAQHAQSSAAVAAHYGKKKGGIVGKLIKLIIVLAILGGLGYFAYANKDMIMEKINGGGSETSAPAATE